MAKILLNRRLKRKLFTTSNLLISCSTMHDGLRSDMWHPLINVTHCAETPALAGARVDGTHSFKPLFLLTARHAPRF